MSFSVFLVFSLFNSLINFILLIINDLRIKIFLKKSLKSLFSFFCSFLVFLFEIRMTVTADGEDVVFDGEIPTDPSHVYDLLMGALSENGRAIVQFIVDGVDAVQSGEFPVTYEKIEVSSLSHDELTLDWLSNQ